MKKKVFRERYTEEEKVIVEEAKPKKTRKVVIEREKKDND